jgi:DNA invertase Pin-like site-specific DNA recombinase
MTTTAIGYLRVSTDDQAEHGAGLALQREAIEATAAAAGLTVTDWFADEGVSGKENLDNRDGLADALAAITPGATLIVYKLDRLARDLIVQEQILAEAWRLGAHVLPTSPSERIYCQPDDPNDPSRTLIRQILGAVSAYERSVIALRLRNGRRRKLRESGYAGGPKPYGLASDDERAAFAEVARLRGMGLTWRALTDTMNSAGYRKRNGQPWTNGELHRAYARANARNAVPQPTLV